MDDRERLLDFVTSLTGEKVLKVEEDLGSGFFKLNVNEAERRQAKHDIRSVEDAVVELVRNSRDAGAKRIFVASAKDSTGHRHLTILDDGSGVPSEFHSSIFEPRVTSKIDNVIEDRYGIHGRGMALYSIRANVDEIKLLRSEPGRGSVIFLDTFQGTLKERKDQSTLPRLKFSGGARISVVSGPHNIWRHLVEMNLDAPELDIYYGSPAEILATLRDVSDESFVWREVSRAADARELSEESARLGLRTSQRNCGRILSKEVGPLPCIRSLLLQAVGSDPVVKVRSRGAQDRKIPEGDLKEFALVIGSTFRSIGDKYFLRLRGEPRISHSSGKIKIEFDVESDDSW